jgi:N-acetylglucosamine-6-phosphate deacetylase
VSSLLISGGDIVVEDELMPRGDIVIQDGVIAAWNTSGKIDPPADATRIDADGLIVAPGLLDIQINGGFGHDFTHEAEAIWEVGSKLPQFGVTGFLPTVVTSGSDAREAMLATLAAGPPAGYRGAFPFGTHFEGPFISPEASGAHDTTFLRMPADGDPDVERWSASAGVRMVTMAPELEGALELTRQLVSRGVVVAAGHSAADRDEAVAGFDAGMRYATHLFNAMPPLRHRDPGLVGAALADPRVTVGMIPDGIHSNPDVLRLAANSAGPDRVSLVTDATAALGMEPGRYVLGGRDVVLDGASVRLADDGRLAGSALTSDEALRRFVEFSGWSVADAVATMTTVPSRLLNLDDRGAIEFGRRADLVLLTQDLRVVMTFIGGERWA